jgi:hypothetical protein
MHDIKFFFSIKLIRQFRGGAKKYFRGSKLSKNTAFQNPGGGAAPPDDYASAPVNRLNFQGGSVKILEL